MNRLARAWAAVGLILLLGFATKAVLAQEDSFARWAQHNPEELTPIDHKPMTNILGFIAVEDSGEFSFAYDRLAGNGKALNYVTQYREFLQNIPVSLLNKEEQLAFWLNLYNTGVIEMIASDLRGAKRLDRHRGEPGQAGDWWLDKFFEVEGVALSLEDIEQNILLRHWQDPNILYGLFYGVKGSAFNTNQGFFGKSVHRQLADLGKAFVNDRDNVRVRRDSLQLSSLYIWNKDLFANDQELIAHISGLADSDLSKDLAKVEEIRDKHKFSWSLNDYEQPRVDLSGLQNRGGGGGGYGGGS